MKYDIYDKEYSYGIPSHTAIDKETVMMMVLSKPHLIVVETGRQCPPINVNLQDIYADIKARLRHADKNIKYRAHQHYGNLPDNL